MFHVAIVPASVFDLPTKRCGMKGMLAAFHYMETYVFLLTTRFRRRKPKCIAAPPGNCPLLISSVRHSTTVLRQLSGCAIAFGLPLLASPL